MSTQIEILIADSQAERGIVLADAFEDSDFATRRVETGAEALERSIDGQPRMVVAQAELPFVDAAKLAEILRANPKTRDVRFLFLGETRSSDRDALGDETMPADAPAEEIVKVARRMLDRQSRIERLERHAGEDDSFAGDLGELRPAEIAQMLHARGATGHLVLESAEPEGAAHEARVGFDGGEIRSASIGPLQGEKALYRMLAFSSGRFHFESGDGPGAGEIEAPTRSVLAEGVRQLEEWDRLGEALPDLDAPVALCVARGELPRIVHPLTQEVLGLLEQEERVRDVVDRSGHPDYQVLRTLQTLVERGLVRVGRVRVAESDGAPPSLLFNEAQCRRLRAFVQAGLGRDASPPDAKLLIVTSSDASLERFIGLLSNVPGVELTPRSERGEFDVRELETVARIWVEDEFSIELIHLPADDRFAALWPFAGHGALGAVILLESQLGRSAERLAAVTATLGARPGARTFHVVLLGQGERLSPTEIRDNLALIDEASMFLLPVESRKDPTSLLRTLFARISP